MPKWFKRATAIIYLGITIFLSFTAINILYFFLYWELSYNYRFDTTVIIYLICMIVGIILFHIGIKRLTYGIASILVQNVNDTLLIQCDVKHFIQLVEPAILYMNKGKILWFSQSAIDLSLKMSLAIAYMVDGNPEKAIQIDTQLFSDPEFIKYKNAKLILTRDLIKAYITKKDSDRAAELLNSYKQLLDEYEPDRKDYDKAKDQLTDMTFRLNILNNVTDGAAEYYENVLQTPLSESYKTVVYWLLANIYRIEGNEEKEILYLRKTSENGYHIYVAEQARCILANKGLTVDEPVLKKIKPKRISYILPVLLMIVGIVGCVPFIWLAITNL